MKQIFLKVYQNGKTSTNATVLNFDREHNTGEIVIDFSEVSYLDWTKQLDLAFADGTHTFIEGSGNTLTVPLLESYLKKGSMTVQPLAKRLVGETYEKIKWQMVALSVRDSLNVLEDDTSITPSIAEQWEIRIEAVEQEELTRQSNEDTRVTNENTRIDNEDERIANENARNVFVAYNPLTPYVVGNKVSYNGSSYVCILDSLGNLPNNTTYWLLIASKGDKGNQWKGAYNAGTQYVVDDVVSYNGSSYICILASLNNLPTNTTYFSLFAQKGNDVTVEDVLISTSTVNALSAKQGKVLNDKIIILEPYLLTNLILNPLMTSTSNWSSSFASIAASNGEIIVTGLGTNQGPRLSTGGIVVVELGHKYKIRTKLRAIDAGITEFNILIFATSGAQKGVTLVSNPVVGQDYFCEYLFEPTDQSGNLTIFFRGFYADSASALNKRWAMGKTEVIDLTKTYGAGYEPNISLVSNFIDTKLGGVFIGTKSLDRNYLKLKNTKIACFGDSITAGNYPSMLGSISGANVVNCGVGGTRITGGDVNYNRFSMVELANSYATGVWTNQDTANGVLNLTNYSTIKTLDLNTVQYLLIMFGTNDFMGGTALGTSASDSTYFIGAIYYIINTLLTAFPHLKIGFITPMWRARKNVGDGLESDTNANGNGVYLIEYVNSMVTACELNHIPVLNLYKNAGITKYNHTKFLSDGLHPNSNGEVVLAQKIFSFVDKII